MGRWTLRWRRPPDRSRARAGPPGPARKRSASQRGLPPMLSGPVLGRAAAASWQCRRRPQESGRARPGIVHSGPRVTSPGRGMRRHVGRARHRIRVCPVQGHLPQATNRPRIRAVSCSTSRPPRVVATEVEFPVCCAGSGRSASPWSCPSSLSPTTQVSGHRVQGQRSRSHAMARQGPLWTRRSRAGRSEARKRLKIRSPAA